MASNQPSLREYARFYGIAENPDRYDPIMYADDTCEPTVPTPPFEGLNPENPEERLREVDRRFCTELMMEKLETEPEDLEFLGSSLQVPTPKGNIWRGILPEVTPSELQGEPPLLTNQAERLFTPFELPTDFAMSPTLSSPVPSVRLEVPSGPDVPSVPINTRDVFDLYNSNSIEDFLIPNNMAAESSNMGPISHLAGDALPLVDAEGIVHQFVTTESDHIPPTPDQEGDDEAASAYLTESEFSAFDLGNSASPLLSDVSPSKSQRSFSIVSPDLTKAKGFSVRWGGGQNAQLRGYLKKRKERKAFMEPVADTGTSCEQKGIVTASLSTINEDTLTVSNGACSSSSITRPANGQDVIQLARASQNAKDNHVLFKTSYEKNLDIMANHTLSSADKRHSCTTQEEQFRIKLGYKSPCTRLRKVPFRPPHDVSSIDHKKSTDSSKAVFSGLGSLSVFMQTRGSDGGYVPSPHDQSLSLSESTGSGRDEFSDVPSPGDNPPDYDKDSSDSFGLPGPAISLQEMVTRAAFDPPPMFFLSTALLRTHLSVIRDMEGWPGNPPKLIYREYGNASSDPRYHCDAEVILAPDTGLILTTPHELTQRFLPGHGPRDKKFNGTRGINSPLRERIFRLMHRYALLVVLICDPGSENNSRAAMFSWIREIRSLAQFCDSYQELSTTLLVPIPDHSASIVLWCFGMGRLRYELFPTDVMKNITEGESEYEVTFRDLGINPFAARLILDNIRVGGFNQFPGFNLYPLPLPSHETVANSSTDSRAFDVFISMTPLERDMEYGSFVGDGVMNRVSKNIESMAYLNPNEHETDSEDIYSTQISLH
ncbi:uncharacterized protein PGRI_080840 [Penicillium griseofulvum]|uniref:Uncharacterized protein n=1 Tax=Penicillium patulum TaxID=5078 RepID=A0A135LV27_PENPA|nr:uncharacterized protein PGRI_080840 [Penicillium griseofulvum]KXG52828.1 hypothetical protein PGRI_080840 [Penicillium griseofulvum]